MRSKEDQKSPISGGLEREELPDRLSFSLIFEGLVYLFPFCVAFTVLRPIFRLYYFTKSVEPARKVKGKVCGFTRFLD